MKKILSLTTKITFAVAIISANATNVSIDVKIPKSNIKNLGNLVNSIKNKIIPDIINNPEKDNSLTIKSEIDPSVSAVEFNIKQERSNQMLTYDHKTTFTHSLGLNCNCVSAEGTEKLTACDLDSTSEIINEYIDGYLLDLTELDQKNNLYFAVGTKANHNHPNTVDINFAYKNVVKPR